MSQDTMETVEASTPMEAATLPASLGQVTSTTLRQGQLLGRYVVLSELGAGAMGVVLAAYDPELDRKVALKLLKNGGDQRMARTRLQREAQALAKLDHRNVVKAFDVGVHEGQVFIAMEFVDGQTLRRWMRSVDGPRPWRVVVPLFAAAGRGLAAAHDAGLIHRDFKPDNVMLGSDGRIRVMDFGLARVDSRELGDDTVPLDELGSLEGPVLKSPLTRAGTVIGTPVYMAPERLTGREADSRSDQFGFCVALYEALYGERPFVEQSIMQLTAAIESGAMKQTPKAPQVPMWLHKVVLRGLAADPDERFESMRALLRALASDPAVRRRKWWAGAAVLGLLGGGGWGLMHAVQQDASICTGMQDKLVGVWDDQRRAQVEDAFEATGLAYAPQTQARVERWLDEYTTQWVLARTEACEATHHGEQSGNLLDLRMACLDQRLMHVQSTVNVLRQADEAVVKRAVQAVASLPTLERCADIDALRAEIPPPEDPQVAAAVTALDDRLVKAGTLKEMGKYKEGRAGANAIVAEAQQLGYEPLIVRAELSQGLFQVETGEYEAAETTLRRAYGAAVEQRMTHEAARASVELMYVVGYYLARFEHARSWALHARHLSLATGFGQPRAAYLSNMGVLAKSEGNYQESRAYFEDALEIRETLFGPKHPIIAASYNNLGIVAGDEGNYEQARALQERALAINEEALGPTHPYVAFGLNNLGVLAESMGNYDEARRYHERALAISEQASGPDHPDVAMSLNNLGNVAEKQGDYDKAREHHLRSLKIYESALGPEHPDVATPLDNLGNMAQLRGEHKKARAYQERALAIREKTLGPEHPELGASVTNLGYLMYLEGELEQARAYQERALAIFETSLGRSHPSVAGPLINLGLVALTEGKPEEARTHQERALAIFEAALGPDHPELAYPLTGLGQALLGLGEPAEAKLHLERALLMRSSADADPSMLAETRFALARALWDAPSGQGGDRSRSRELAELARAVYTERSAAELDEVQHWLADHL